MELEVVSHMVSLVESTRNLWTNLFLTGTVLDGFSFEKILQILFCKRYVLQTVHFGGQIKSC